MFVEFWWNAPDQWGKCWWHAVQRPHDLGLECSRPAGCWWNAVHNFGAYVEVSIAVAATGRKDRSGSGWPSWRHLGAVWGGFDALLGSPGPSWGRLGPSWKRRHQNLLKYKKLGKHPGSIIDLCLLGAPLGRPLGRLGGLPGLGGTRLGPLGGFWGRFEAVLGLCGMPWKRRHQSLLKYKKPKNNQGQS